MRRSGREPFWPDNFVAKYILMCRSWNPRYFRWLPEPLYSIRTIFLSAGRRDSVFRLLLPGMWFVDSQAMPCQILRTSLSSVTYLRGDRVCVTRFGRFQEEFEPVGSAGAQKLLEERETASHLKKLRAMKASRMRGN